MQASFGVCRCQCVRVTISSGSIEASLAVVRCVTAADEEEAAVRDGAGSDSLDSKASRPRSFWLIKESG